MMHIDEETSMMMNVYKDEDEEKKKETMINIDKDEFPEINPREIVGKKSLLK